MIALAGFLLGFRCVESGEGWAVIRCPRWFPVSALREAARSLAEKHGVSARFLSDRVVRFDRPRPGFPQDPVVLHIDGDGMI